jgi:hypothetical protein
LLVRCSTAWATLPVLIQSMSNTGYSTCNWKLMDPVPGAVKGSLVTAQVSGLQRSRLWVHSTWLLFLSQDTPCVPHISATSLFHLANGSESRVLNGGFSSSSTVHHFDKHSMLQQYYLNQIAKDLAFQPDFSNVFYS